MSHAFSRRSKQIFNFAESVVIPPIDIIQVAYFLFYILKAGSTLLTLLYAYCVFLMLQDIRSYREIKHLNQPSQSVDEGTFLENQAPFSASGASTI